MEVYTNDNQETMPIVIVGHVDHGKSTLIGRLLADAGALPDGKLEQVKEYCRLNSRPFEYSFLLDALKEEQAQGITIDTARCFFKTDKRKYLILDAPGHIEFLKNMVTGASHAQAALLTIDAQEGVQENSKRHGFLLSLLGIKQIVVVINKMDLVGYSEDVYKKLVADYTAYLRQVDVTPTTFIPASAREGENLTQPSKHFPWYKGPYLLELMDDLKLEKPDAQKPFRLPVQDIYKFTANNDDRRIIAGSVESGSIKVGDRVIFMPSKKTATIQSIEGFNTQTKTSISAGYATGFTIDPQLYLRPGEIMCKQDEAQPYAAQHIQATIFWLGKQPMIKGKRYKLKITTAQTGAFVKEIIKVVDAAHLVTLDNPSQIDRFQIAECIIETEDPIAFDRSHDLVNTSRIVLIDEYDMVGGGVITHEPVMAMYNTVTQPIAQQSTWQKSNISLQEREQWLGQPAMVIFVQSATEKNAVNIAQTLERCLLHNNVIAYYLDTPKPQTIPTNATGFTRTEDEAVQEASQQSFTQSVKLLLDAGIIIVAPLLQEQQMLSAALKEYPAITVTLHPDNALIIDQPTNPFIDQYIKTHLAKPISMVQQTLSQRASLKHLSPLKKRKKH